MSPTAPPSAAERDEKMAPLPLPLSLRTPVEEAFRLVIKTSMFNALDPEPTPSPQEPRIGVKRVLPPYLGEMGYEIKFHLARVEPWLRNGWKILTRRPDFYPPGTVVDAPEFFGAVDQIMADHILMGAGAGLYAPDTGLAEMNIQQAFDGEQMQLRLSMANVRKLHRQAASEILLRRLFMDWLDYDGRPVTDYDRNIFSFTETCVAETYLRRAESLRPSYRPHAFEHPLEARPPHVGVQSRAVRNLVVQHRNSDPDWMVATAKAIGAHLDLPVLAYGHPGGCIIPDSLDSSWDQARGADQHLARELGYLKSCRLMLAPDSGWCDLMSWLGIPVLLELIHNPIAFEGLRDTFQPRIVLVDRNAELGPQIDALLTGPSRLPFVDPRKSGVAKFTFPWDY
jgi:hypothetical protein